MRKKLLQVGLILTMLLSTSCATLKYTAQGNVLRMDNNVLQWVIEKLEVNESQIEKLEANLPYINFVNREEFKPVIKRYLKADAERKGIDTTTDSFKETTRNFQENVGSFYESEANIIWVGTDLEVCGQHEVLCYSITNWMLRILFRNYLTSEQRKSMCSTVRQAYSLTFCQEKGNEA